MSNPDQEFWRGRRVLVTGHTGFKGAWLSAWLEMLGADVHGFALAPEPGANLFRDLGDWTYLTSMTGDIRDREAVKIACAAADPDIVIHLAAQSLVRRAHRDPLGTYATNVQGTGNLLETLDACTGLRAILVVTSDKCYSNDNSGRPFVESDPLGGSEPYSASKAAQETLSAGWRKGILENRERAPRLATARAGNVIGGGDWSEDRILPDLFRAIGAGQALEVRNPDATRPWQHVLDVLAGYMRYVEAMVRDDDAKLPNALNFGPETETAQPVRWVLEHVIETARREGVEVEDWHHTPQDGPVEAKNLALDASLSAKTLNWRPRLSQADAAEWTARWHAQAQQGASPRDLVEGQISAYQELAT